VSSTPAQLEKWRDPVSNQLPKNPWAKGSVNVTEQGWLSEHEPELAAYLKATANTGVTYSFLQKQKEEAVQRKLLRELEYTHEQHRVNPYLNNASVDERGAFRRKIGDATADIYQREATEPITIPWHPTLTESTAARSATYRTKNVTAMSRIAHDAPQLRALLDRSLQLERQWAGEDLKAFAASDAANKERRESAQRLLAQR
jgi:hypothetical protein